MNDVPFDILSSAIRKAVPKKSSLLVAVSGGIDSIALLHSLLGLSSEMEFVLEVIHVDHKLRKESHRDADFVASVCKLNAIAFHLCEANEPPRAGENLEAWGRRIRYQYFRAIRQKQKLDYVLTAHNANDLAETFLMRVFSNKELKTIEYQDSKRRLIRPFLEIRRETLERFIKDNAHSHIIDQTNFDSAFTRNRIRQRIIPFLEVELGGQIVDVLVKSAKRAADDIAFIDSLALESASGLGSHEFGSRAWLKALRCELKDLAPSVSYRVIQKILHPYLGFSLGRDKCLEVLRFFSGKALRIQLPSGLTLQRSQGGIVLLKTDL
jgi:tRNA(Ile)-lysidine synthase